LVCASAHDWRSLGAFLVRFRASAIPLSPGASRCSQSKTLREQQSSVLAYFDTFLVFAAVGVALSFLVLPLKPSAAAKDALVAGSLAILMWDYTEPVGSLTARCA